MIWLVWLKQFADKYLGGGNHGSRYNDIQEFDPLTDQWKEVDRMIKARSAHAVAVVNYSEVAQYCNWGVSRYSHFFYRWFDNLSLEFLFPPSNFYKQKRSPLIYLPTLPAIYNTLIFTWEIKSHTIDKIIVWKIIRKFVSRTEYKK